MLHIVLESNFQNLAGLAWCGLRAGNGEEKCGCLVGASCRLAESLVRSFDAAHKEAAYRASLDGFDSDDLEHSGPSGCQVLDTVMQPLQRSRSRLGSERHGCASQDCEENQEYPDPVHAPIASPRP